MKLEGTKVAVVGLGKSGQSAAKYLRRHGAQVVLTDTRAPQQWPAVEGEQPQPIGSFDLKALDLVVLSPGVAMDDPFAEEARRQGVRVTGELEVASWHLQGPTLGITGSNGKTTTTAMTGHILRHAGIPCQVGGNIGVPPTEMVATSSEEQWNVLELSSFQLETIEDFSARIAVVLNLTPDHLDRHHTMEIYAAAKRRLLETQKPGSDAVINADDASSEDFAKATSAAVSWFSMRREVARGIFLRDGELILNGSVLMKQSAVPLPGAHNVQNAMAAALAASLAGAEPLAIAEAIASFPGVEHRIEFTRELHGVRYYNDSKATNVDATEKALEAFPGNVWIILGGKDKGSDYAPLRPLLEAKAKGVLLIGAAAEKIASHVNGSAPLERCETLQSAVEYAHSHAQPGDIVLLAPACASFDQFENFEHRGRVFKQLVRSLPE